jgi:hypothetical protein
LITFTRFISTNVCNFIAVLAAANMSGWVGIKTFFRD